MGKVERWNQASEGRVRRRDTVLTSEKQEEGIMEEQEIDKE